MTELRAARGWSRADLAIALHSTGLIPFLPLDLVRRVEDFGQQPGADFKRAFAKAMAITLDEATAIFTAPAAGDPLSCRPR